MQSAFCKLFHVLRGLIYWVYITPFNISLVRQDSRKLSHSLEVDKTNNAGQVDPELSPHEEPEGNKPNKPCESGDKNSTNKLPIYPHTPVKVYVDAHISKSDITKDFKDLSIIYM